MIYRKEKPMDTKLTVTDQSFDTAFKKYEKRK